MSCGNAIASLLQQEGATILMIILMLLMILTQTVLGEAAGVGDGAEAVLAVAPAVLVHVAAGAVEGAERRALSDR